MMILFLKVLLLFLLMVLFLNDNVVAADDDGYGVVGGDGYDSYDDRTHLWIFTSSHKDGLFLVWCTVNADQKLHLKEVNVDQWICIDVDITTTIFLFFFLFINKNIIIGNYNSNIATVKNNTLIISNHCIIIIIHLSNYLYIVTFVTKLHFKRRVYKTWTFETPVFLFNISCFQH